MSSDLSNNVNISLYIVYSMVMSNALVKTELFPLFFYEDNLYFLILEVGT